MEVSRLPLTDLASSPTLLAASEQIDEQRKKQLAKDFESVLVGRVLEQMKETVGDWGSEEEDAAGEQVQGLFWLHLARDIADKGGFGLWKDIYRFFKDMEQGGQPAQGVNKNI